MGGNVFSDTIPFEHKKIPSILKQINSVLNQTGSAALPIGSCALPTIGKTSGDMDAIVDADILADYFSTHDIKIVRRKVKDLFDSASMETTLNGVSVHVKVQLEGNAHQVDLMIVPNAETAQQFHIHDIPEGSPYKGVHKHMALSKLAKDHGLLWSPYEGLWTRGPDCKKNKFFTNDLDTIAKTLLGPLASAGDLSSLDSMLQALPNQGQQLIQTLEQDPVFCKKLSKTERHEWIF
jgi:hypothetical protein